jgi:hypothetical protein
MSSHLTDQWRKIDQIFGRALPLVESALLQAYRLPPEDAGEMKRCLRDWFHGFARRPGSPSTEEGLMPHLMLMACQAGHVYWAGKLTDSTPADDAVKRSLTLGPYQIAIELESSIKGDDPKGHHREEDG